MYDNMSEAHDSGWTKGFITGIIIGSGIFGLFHALLHLYFLKG